MTHAEETIQITPPSLDAFPFSCGLDQPTVEALRARFQEDLLGRKPFASPGGLFDRTGGQWIMVDVDRTRNLYAPKNPIECKKPACRVRDLGIVRFDAVELRFSRADFGLRGNREYTTRDYYKVGQHHRHNADFAQLMIYDS